MSDAINPDHYKQLPVEAIEIIEAMIAGAPDNKAAYLHGQAAKYDLRLWKKGESLEDFLSDWGKHIWYALRLESHLLELIEKQKADEQRKAADLQSLKDHPFGKLKQPAWTPKVGDWVRIKKTENAFGWIEGMMDEHDGKVVLVSDIEDRSIVHEGWYFSFDWLEPAEQPAIKQSLTTQPPDGWRWLEVGEVIRKGDQGFEKGLLYAIEPMKIGMTLQAHWMPTIRRNRFEVGEKVVHVDDRHAIPYEIDEYIYSKDAYVVKYKDGRYMYHWSKLAPYIEDAK